MTASTTPPTLTDADVTLRPMVDADRDTVLAAASDGELWNLFFTNVAGPDTIDRYMAVAADDQRSGRSMPFVVEHDRSRRGCDEVHADRTRCPAASRSARRSTPPPCSARP